MARRKHPDKELEAILRDAETKNWRVEVGKKYFKLKCPCSAQHYKVVHVTPSSGYYTNHLLQALESRTCWKGEGK